MSLTISDLITPGILTEVRRLEFRARRSVDADLLGKYKSAFRGTGLIFSDIREYQPGDDIRSIHWKVTARTGKVYVKDFEEDRQLTMLVAVDISRSTAFGTARANQTRMAEFAALILLLARQNNDKAGLCLFDDQVQEYIPPAQSGRNHFLKLLHTLIESRTPRPATNIAHALDYISLHQRKRAIVFIISDFYSPPFEDTLRKLAIRHETICVHCMDDAESTPPAVGLITVQDAETGAVRTVDTSSHTTRKDFAFLQKQRTAHLGNLCRSTGADYLAVTSHPMKSLTELMRRRTARMK